MVWPPTILPPVNGRPSLPAHDSSAPAGCTEPSPEGRPGLVIERAAVRQGFVGRFVSAWVAVNPTTTGHRSRLPPRARWRSVGRHILGPCRPVAAEVSGSA